MAVAIAVFAGFVTLTWFFRDLPLWVAGPLTALCLAWYGSLQHETIHNHPTSSRQLNMMLGSVPLSLWLPYRIYRLTHLQHHRYRGRLLTDAQQDPESFFLKRGSLGRQGRLRRLMHGANCTLAGRLLLGPALSLTRFGSSELRCIWAGDRCRRVIWLRHVAAAGLVFFWITRVCHIPAFTYFLSVVYPSIAITHLRSFHEHRASHDPARRTVSVETGRLWALLFLNNNLHIAHHAYPKIAWYQLPAAWQRMRQAAVSDGLVIEGGYSQLARSFLLNPIMGAEHPGTAEASVKRA